MLFLKIEALYLKEKLFMDRKQKKSQIIDHAQNLKHVGKLKSLK